MPSLVEALAAPVSEVSRRKDVNDLRASCPVPAPLSATAPAGPVWRSTAAAGAAGWGRR